MKIFTLTTVLFVLISFTSNAQFPEGFESTVPPTGWVTFIGANGLGTVQNWKETPENKKKKEFSKDFDEVFDADKRKPH